MFRQRPCVLVPAAGHTSGGCFTRGARLMLEPKFRRAPTCRRRGVVFIENGWYAGFLWRKTVGHVDLWDDDRTAAYDAAHTREILERADSVVLWEIKSPSWTPNGAEPAQRWRR